MSPSKKRALITRTLALAVVACVVLLSDGILLGDSTIGSQSILASGDSTACMK